MALLLASASSQRLVCSGTSLVTGRPCAVGAWVKPNVNNVAMTIWCAAAADATNWMRLWLNPTGTRWAAQEINGAASANAASGSAVVGAWSFVIARFISATNRRIDALSPGAAASHGQDTTSRTPAGIATMSIGSQEGSVPADFFDGQIGEIWYANADIQPDGAALSDRTLRQLAYGGPFSLPHVARNLIEYRSFREAATAGEGADVYTGAGKTARIWTNTNGVLVGAHPPLPYWYAGPRQAPRFNGI